MVSTAHWLLCPKYHHLYQEHRVSSPPKSSPTLKFCDSSVFQSLVPEVNELSHPLKPISHVLVWVNRNFAMQLLQRRIPYQYVLLLFYKVFTKRSYNMHLDIHKRWIYICMYIPHICSTMHFHLKSIHWCISNCH